MSSPIVVRANQPPLVIAPARGKQGPPGGVPLAKMARAAATNVTSSPVQVVFDVPPVENAPGWDVSAAGVVVPADGNYRVTVAAQWSGVASTDVLTVTIDRSTSGQVVALDDAASTAAPLKTVSRVVSVTAGETVGLSAAVDVAGPVSLDSIEMTVEQMPVTGVSPGGGGDGAVASVNGQTGTVSLDATDVGAEPTGTTTSAVTAHVNASDPHPAIDVELATKIAVADRQVAYLAPGGDGSLDTHLQDQLDLAAFTGGLAELTIPPGDWTLSTGVTYDASAGPLIIRAKGAKITYSGTGVLFTLMSSDGAANHGGCAIEGGEWNVTAAADGVFRNQDVQGIRFQDVKMDSADGFGIELRNEIRWTENTKILGCAFNGRHSVVFTPQSISGGAGGTESFARTRVQNCWVGGGGAGQPKFWLRGGVYGSTFVDIGGNVPSGSEVYRFSGNTSTPATTPNSWFKGTTIDGSQDFETVDGGLGGACLFRDDGYGGSEITLRASVHLSNNMVFNHATEPAKFANPREYNAVEYTERTTDPIAPEPGFVKIYPKGGLFYQRTSDGTVTQLGGGGGAVAEVNGQTGDVALGADDIPQANSLLPGSPAETQGAINALHQMTAARTVTVQYDEVAEAWPARPADVATGTVTWVGPGTAGQPAGADELDTIILDTGTSTVISVNGLNGVVVLDAAAVGAVDAAGGATLVELVDSSVEWLKVLISDDGTDDTAWPDRLTFHYETSPGVFVPVGRFNQYGAIEVDAPATTGQAAIFRGRSSGQTGAIVLVEQYPSGPTLLQVLPDEATFSVPVTAPNIGEKLLYLSTVAPLPDGTTDGTLIARGA